MNDVRWDEVPTLYGAGPRDRAYALRTDEDGEDVRPVRRRRARRAPADRARTTCARRTARASARRATSRPGALAQLLDRPLGVKGVEQPVAPRAAASIPETEESARASIPLGVRTLGRAVSLLDYEDFARAFTGVAKANAAVLPLRGGRTVVVTVAFEGGDRLDDLADVAADARRPARRGASCSPGRPQTFRLALKVAVDPAYEADAVLAGVEAALRAAYSFDARALRPSRSSARRSMAVAHTVAGVLARRRRPALHGHDRRASPTGCSRSGPPSAPGGTAIPAGVLVLDAAPFDWLEG